MNKVMNILLADDDKDDCLFFKEAISEIPIDTSLIIIHDGEQLMQYLKNNTDTIPQALFLDLNMHRKNGLECLTEIKNHELLTTLPVIIFSTSYDPRIGNQLFKTGAHYYICKPVDFDELKNLIHRALLLLQQNSSRPSEKNFLLTKLKTASR